jgi:hypothetical protein
MVQEVESLSNLVGLLLWQREELEGRDPEASDVYSLAEFHGLTSRPPSSAGCITPRPTSASGTPRALSATAVPASGGGVSALSEFSCNATGERVTMGGQMVMTKAVVAQGLDAQLLSARGYSQNGPDPTEPLPRTGSQLSGLGAGVSFHGLLPSRVEAGHA